MFGNLKQLINCLLYAKGDDGVSHQLEMWLKGKPWHNPIRDECCPDFSCCRPELLAPYDVRKTFCEAYHAKQDDKMDAMLLMFLVSADTDHKWDAVAEQFHHC